MPAPRCPICSKPSVPEFKPFCSSRCKQVDLGRWFGERYAVPGEPVDPEVPPPRDED